MVEVILCVVLVLLIALLFNAFDSSRGPAVVLRLVACFTVVGLVLSFMIYIGLSFWHMLLGHVFFG